MVILKYIVYQQGSLVLLILCFYWFIFHGFTKWVSKTGKEALKVGKLKKL